MKVVLIRHPPPAIAPGMCYGRLDVGVDPAAHPLMDRIAANPALQGAAHVWTSPALRCRGLAETIGLTLAVPISVDERLQELDFGTWEGLAWNAVPRADLDRWAASPSEFAPPGGESGAALVARIRAFHTGLLAARQDCVVVTHGGPLKVLIPLLTGDAVDLLAAAPPMGSIRIIVCPAPPSPRIRRKAERRNAGYNSFPE